MARLIFYILFITMLFSCNRQNGKFYKETGELDYEEKVVNDSTIIQTEYYANGNRKQEVTYVNSLPKGLSVEYYENGNRKREMIWINSLEGSGFCKEYYSDGALKWDGRVVRGEVFVPEAVRHAEKLNVYLDLKNVCDTLIVGKTYEFRIIVPIIHEEAYLVSYSGACCEFNKGEDTAYPYSLVPIESGCVYVCVNFMDEEGAIIVGKNECRFRMVVKAEI